MDDEEKQHAALGFVTMLGVEVVEGGPDRVVLSMDATAAHQQPHGVVHGGVYCTLVETAASIGGHLWLDGKGTVVGVNNNTDFIRPFFTGRLLSTATPVQRGRTQQLWLVEITDEAGKLISRGQVRLQNIEPRD